MDSFGHSGRPRPGGRTLALDATELNTPPFRQSAIQWRISLTRLFSSIRSWVQSVSNGSWSEPPFLGLAIWDEIRTGAASFNHFVCYSLVVKFEVASGLVEWRVDNRVLDDDLTHTGAFSLLIDSLVRNSYQIAF
jgi:hypothetical protein